MKKLLFLIFAILFAGCSDSSDDNPIIKEMEDAGLTEEQATSFYVYVNSIYLGFVSFDNLDQEMEDNKYDISVDDYNNVMLPFTTAAETYETFEKSKKFNDFDDYILSDTGPSGIMNNMEEYRRNIGYMEKGIMVGSFNTYTDDIINRMNITEDQKQMLYTLYEETVYSNNSFLNVNEDWKKVKSN